MAFKWDGKSRVSNDNYRNNFNDIFKTNPMLGVGFGNYSQISKSDIEEAVLKDLGVYDWNNYMESAHAHNVYYNYLVSGGLVIFLIFVLFWLFILWAIFKLVKAKNSDWIVISSFSVLLINLGIGFFNTTLHHEHAIFSMFVLGLMISRFRQKIDTNNNNLNKIGIS